uniref:Protein krueppel n=1 Tax=Glossina pallidipes TaxID=7398 RepID=A0A1A9ZLE8_GLOPL
MEQEQFIQLEVCRICVNCFPLAEMDFISIFDINEEFSKELLFIQQEINTWELNISPGDGLPQRMCANCFSKFRSIETFRQECWDAQQKLMQTLIQPNDIGFANSGDNLVQSEKCVHFFSNLEHNESHQLLTNGQNQIPLHEYSEYEGNFSQLMDSSSMMLPNDIMDSTNELDLIAATEADLCSLTTANPSANALYLNESGPETKSVESEMIAKTEVTQVISEDFEALLQHSIIPNKSKNDCVNINEEAVQKVVEKNKVTIQKVEVLTEPNTIMTSSNDCWNSDNECDDPKVNERLLGITFACYYCYCPDVGAIGHIIFANDEDLSEHFFIVHDPNRPYNCPDCTLTYRTQNMRDNHYRLQHLINQGRECNFCHQPVDPLAGQHIKHQLQCLYVGDWECDNCKQKFLCTSLARFRLHQLSHDPIKQLKCTLCDRNFLRRANLEAHQKTHANDNLLAYKCHECAKGFSNEYNLKYHKYVQHKGDIPAKCEFCHKGFVSISYLQRHIRKTHFKQSSDQDISALLRCPRCEAQFETLQQLCLHMQQSKDQNGKCIDLPVNNLKDNNKRRQQGQGSYICPHCPRRFRVKTQFQRHVSAHDLTNSKSFQCQECEAHYSSAWHLEKHIRMAHVNANTYVCEECGKCFAFKKDLNDHQLYHTVQLRDVDVQGIGDMNAESLMNGIDIPELKHNFINENHIVNDNDDNDINHNHSSGNYNDLIQLPFNIMDRNVEEVTEIATATTTSDALTMHSSDDQMMMDYVIDNSCINFPHSSNDNIINGIIQNDLNISGNHAYLLPSTSSNSHGQLDQYFMSSLLDTEQEVTVA